MQRYISRFFVFLVVATLVVTLGVVMLSVSCEADVLSFEIEPIYSFSTINLISAVSVWFSSMATFIRTAWAWFA